MITLNIVSIYINDEVCREIEKAAGSIEGAHIDSRGLPVTSVLPDIGVTEQPDVLIIELDSDDMVIDEIESDITRIAKNTAVIVTHQNTDVSMMRTLMRLGVRDFVPQPINCQDMVNVLTEVLAKKRARIMSDSGRLASVFTFFNAKGGNGASTLAVNIAATLANRENVKVALLDFDIQLGSVDLFLDLHPKSTIQDAITQSHRIDSVFLKALMSKHDSNLEVLTSPAHLTSISVISAEDVHLLLDAAAEAYDVVIVDMPRLFTSWTVEIMKYSEKIFLVLQNSLSSVRDAKMIVDNLPLLGMQLGGFELINNRAEAAMGAVSENEFRETLKLKTIHHVRTDYKAAINAQNQGKLIYEVAPHSKLKKDIDRMADYLEKIAMGDEQKKTESGKGILSRLLSKG